MAAFDVRHIWRRKSCVSRSWVAEAWILTAVQSFNLGTDVSSVVDVVSDGLKIDIASNQPHTSDSQYHFVLLPLMARAIPSI
jgi:hypothetical protein